MNFVAALKKTGSILKAVGPIAAMAVPGASVPVAIGTAVLDKMAERGVLTDKEPDGVAAAVARIPDDIVSVEALLPEDGQGAAKYEHVRALFESNIGMAVAQEVLGKLDPPMKIEYDAPELKSAIAMIVGGYNKLAVLKASVKVVPR